ncbi:MAG: protein kinase, partial [Proteobacteria bacterium]|nr:protein kinase [Pseudomonadota bacterium]
MKTIGRYEVVGRLGRGGMSMVYKAWAPVTGRLVALKILQPRNEIFAELVGLERLKELFVAEAKIMGGLSHDHVAKVLDCDEHEGQPFIVLEYFAHSLGAFIGESYRVEAPSRIISVAKAQVYLVQALKGLERLHFAGIIHRDIKPYNLMLT